MRFIGFTMLCLFLLPLVSSALWFSHTVEAVLQFSSNVCTGFDRFSGQVGVCLSKSTVFRARFKGLRSNNVFFFEVS